MNDRVTRRRIISAINQAMMSALGTDTKTAPKDEPTKKTVQPKVRLRGLDPEYILV